MTTLAFREGDGSNRPPIRAHDRAFASRFPVKVSPDADRAAAHALAWVQKVGLLGDDAGVRRLAKARAAEISAYFHPNRTGTALEMLADLELWMLLYDDTFDEAVGRSPELARSATQDLMRLTGLAPADATAVTGLPTHGAITALAQAWNHIWERESEGMSPQWQKRARGNWALWLNSFIEEASYRAMDIHPDFGSYVRLRRKTSAVQAILDANETAGGFTIPERAVQTPLLKEITEIACDVVCFINDIFSVDKEQAHGDRLNLVLVLEHHNALDRPEAVREVRGLVNRRLDRYQALASSTPEFCASLGLKGRDRKHVEVWVAEAADLMGGLYHWSALSGRYRHSDDAASAR